MTATVAARALEPREVAGMLQAMGTAISAELRALPLDVLSWRPAPGEWCVKECVGHMIEAERRGFNGRIRLMLAESEPALRAWDQEQVARDRNDHGRPASEVLAEFDGLRADSVALVSGLTSADLSRGGTHEKVGYLRVQDLLHEWLHHDRNHFRQMQANVQVFVWPTMANAQRFSAD